MDPRSLDLPTAPGTYALLLELSADSSLAVGSLGLRTFESGVFLYVGSAFGPGGLRARLLHHLLASPRPHWHIDYLRGVASISQVWTTADPRRLECAWSLAAESLRGAHRVTGFGASDCRCVSHLVGLPRIPTRSAFRRHLRKRVPSCASIERFTI
jgi:Uri superfamily endonuclease